MSFPCTGCGLCCQNIRGVELLKAYVLSHGGCKYFDTVHKACTRYDTRPDICRVDKMFELVYHKEYTRKQFYILNANVCNSLQEASSLDQTYRVILNGEGD